MIQYGASLIHCVDPLTHFDEALYNYEATVIHSVEPLIHYEASVIHSVEADSSLLLANRHFIRQKRIT